MDDLSFYLITGLSGAGKSHALRAFEDMGFFCVDNLPRELVDDFVSILRRDDNGKDKVALALDVREGDFAEAFPQIVADIRGRGLPLKILFLEATTEALINRYMESRRPHPLGDERSLEEAIALEKELLEPVRDESDMVIDTTEINIHQFRGLLTEMHQPETTDRLTLSFTSFGFKHGVPAHLDTIFDVRFLDNPHYEEDLKELSGLDDPIDEFMSDQSLAEQFLEQVTQTLEMMIGGYYNEGKIVMSVGVGCTGGQHRSVWAVDKLARHFRDRDDCRTVVTHRDVDTENTP
jgi:UPF0042 nucleotide-binding protein